MANRGFWRLEALKQAPKPISRRGFLKAASVIGGGLAGHSSRSLAQGHPTGESDHFAMLTDLTRCIGCRRCEKACNEANELPPPDVPFDAKEVFEEKRRTHADAYTVVNRYWDPHRLGVPVYVKEQCMHCAEPACVSACPVAALRKSPEGPVTYNADVCIGCRYCMMSCPFRIPTYEFDDPLYPRIQKCFMCHGRIAEGEMPACAVECPVEAINFGRRRDLIQLARDRIHRHPDRYIDHIYGEKEAGGTDWLYISSVPFEQLGFKTDVGETAFPRFTEDFLSFVPLVLVAWPALLGGIYMMAGRRVWENGSEQSGGLDTEEAESHE